MEMIIYSLKVAAILIAFYLLYKWVMSRETHHSANRFLLLGSAALAFVLPLCSISIHTSSLNPTVAISQALWGSKR
ncbi:MAG: hypothetical protein E7069_12985 [Bacteroidales bacterium]|jgi:hypothetical protein|nr:hypothetical protein [Bacteroidales bacterium]